MGDFSVSMRMVGGHGCDRQAREGDPLGPTCDSQSCPDCFFRKMVGLLVSKGMIPTGGKYHATMTHWPDDPDGGITDDLRANVRVRNSFIKEPRK